MSHPLRPEQHPVRHLQTCLRRLRLPLERLCKTTDWTEWKNADDERRAVTKELLGEFTNGKEVFQFLLADSLAYFTKRNIPAERVRPDLERAAKYVADCFLYRPPSLPHMHDRASLMPDLLAEVNSYTEDEQADGKDQLALSKLWDDNAAVQTEAARHDALCNRLVEMKYLEGELNVWLSELGESSIEGRSILEMTKEDKQAHREWVASEFQKPEWEAKLQDAIRGTEEWARQRQNTPQLPLEFMQGPSLVDRLAEKLVETLQARNSPAAEGVTTAPTPETKGDNGTGPTVEITDERIHRVEQKDKRSTERGEGQKDESTFRLLSLFTNGIANERIEKATLVLQNDTLTVNEKLTQIDSLIPFPATASAEALGAMLGVKRQAVAQTEWWNQNRKGEKASEIGRRQTNHKKRAEGYEPPHTKDT